MYPIARRLLFCLDPETGHKLALRFLAAAPNVPGALSVLSRMAGAPHPSLPVEVMGICFPNPLGLAAGLDKQGAAVDAFSALGFGFIELGTVTPLPQPGNPRPRLFRVTSHDALINRMGFNSLGLTAFLRNLRRTQRRPIIGINIGKNAATPIESAVDDYLAGLTAIYDECDYIAINISSPNTRNLRKLHSDSHLDRLLAALQERQRNLADRQHRQVALVLKIAPDLDDENLKSVASQLLHYQLDGVIVSNTTTERTGLSELAISREAGGLSGAPLRAASTEMVRRLYAQLHGKIPIIGVGGIDSAQSAWEKLQAGADLIQIYTGLIYHGPHLVRVILSGIEQRIHTLGCTDLQQALRQARAEHDLTP